MTRRRGPDGVEAAPARKSFPSDSTTVGRGADSDNGPARPTCLTDLSPGHFDVFTRGYFYGYRHGVEAEHERQERQHAALYRLAVRTVHSAASQPTDEEARARRQRRYAEAARRWRGLPPVPWPADGGDGLPPDARQAKPPHAEPAATTATFTRGEDR